MKTGQNMIKAESYYVSFVYFCILKVHSTWCTGESESEVAKSCPTVVTPWTVAHQAPLSMGFPRQEYWSGLPFLPPQDLPDPRIKPGFSALQADSLLTEPQGKPQFLSFILLKIGRIIMHVIATAISNSNMFLKLVFKDLFI